jgi:glycerol uptake facilitator-like aquaporin
MGFSLEMGDTKASAPHQQQQQQQQQGSRFYGQIIRYKGERPVVSHPGLSPIALALGMDELYGGDVWRGTVIEIFAMIIFMVVHCAIVSKCVKQYPPPAYDTNLYIGGGHFLLMGFYIICFAAPSGGHMNPLITWATVTTGHTPVMRGLLYTAAQSVGGFVGALVFDRISPNGLKLAACSIGEMGPKDAFLAETFFSIALLVVAYGIAFDARQGQLFGPILAPLFISATLGLLIWSSGGLAMGYTGAGMNPIMCWAPNVVVGGAAMDNQWVYWAGPAVGALMHAVVYVTIPPHHKAMYEELGDKVEWQDCSGI